MTKKSILVIGGKPIQFDSVELAQAHIKKHNITDVEIVDLDYHPLRREIPEESVQMYEMLESRIPMFFPMSGQEKRRERRERERQQNRRK